ncbi:hypothetical protein BDD12DRAFT_846542 [Trichophaea hybrida]|nr:hypothetical protein BDD12DRAFT_846542 [Trichophaea hybrida]
MPRHNPCSFRVALLLTFEIILICFAATLVNHIKQAKTDKETAILLISMTFLILSATSFQISIVTTARNQARNEWEEEFQAAAMDRLIEIQGEYRRGQAHIMEEEHEITMEEELEEREEMLRQSHEEMEFIVPANQAERTERARARAEAEELERRIQEAFGGRPRPTSRERRERGMRRMSIANGPSTRAR